MAFLGFIFGKKATYKFDEKSNGWLAYYTDIKGIVGQGESKKEALQNLERDVKEIAELELQLGKAKKETYSGDVQKPSMAHS